MIYSELQGKKLSLLGFGTMRLTLLPDGSCEADEKQVAKMALAVGWYRGSMGAWSLRNQYGTETKLLFRLEIVYADGSEDAIITDGTW